MSFECFFLSALQRAILNILISYKSLIRKNPKRHKPNNHAGSGVFYFAQIVHLNKSLVHLNKKLFIWTKNCSFGQIEMDVDNLWINQRGREVR